MPVKPRAAQRRRTRKAIVDAAAALLAGGTTPSIDEIAAAADVSRRTVYMYFPTLDQLLIDAALGALSRTTIDRAIAAAPHGETPEDRVERLVRALQRASRETERLGRTLIRLTAEGTGAAERGRPRRGYRRIEWIETALAPLRPRLGPARWRRLVAAIAMVVGWEALIVQRDVCGLSAAEGESLSAWAARALVRGALTRDR
jgi:AcrR family transcriptional regulator